MNAEERQIYFEGFKQGKKDALEMCDSCKHKVSAEDIKQIRTNVIDEFASKLVQWKPQNEEYMSFSDVVFQIAEQLKEQK